MDSPLVIPRRFNGPPDSANGGISAGLLAARLAVQGAATAAEDSAIEVTLRRPPPLEHPMTIEDGIARDGDDVIMQARVVARPGPAVEPVSFDHAVSASAGFDGLSGHPFPTCFVCGPDRPDRDGLEIFAGPVGGAAVSRTAAPFVPRPEHGLAIDADADPVQIGPEIVWAALDCTGGWAIGLPQRPAVLGRITASVFGLPALGEHCVVVGELDGRDGRKAFTRTSIYGADGRELGRAAATWIEIVRPD